MTCQLLLNRDMTGRRIEFPLLSFLETVTISLTSEISTWFFAFRKADSHFITITKDGTCSPFNGIPAFVTQIARDYISLGTVATCFKCALRITLSKGYHAPVMLENGPSCLQLMSRMESTTSCIQRIPSPSPPKAAPKLKYSHVVESTLRPHDPGKLSPDLSCA